MWKPHLYTNNMSDNYAEETKPLFKLLKTEAFRFVIVRYNHYSLVSQLEQDLKRLFPNRPLAKADAQKLTYQDISKQYFDLKQGFFFLENFDILLKEERNSLNKETPPMKIENERRRHITAGLNLRRDKLAQFPIALFVFIPTTSDPLFAKTIMEKMPDLWSFRSFMMDLEKETTVTKGNSGNIIIGNGHLGKTVISNPKKENELNRLLGILKRTPKNNNAYKIALYPQIVDIQNELGYFKQALLILNEWEKNVTYRDRDVVFFRKGDIFSMIGNFEESLKNFEKAQLIFDSNKNTHDFVRTIHLIGATQMALGNLDKAMDYFKKGNSLINELNKNYPNDIEIKYSLAGSYEHLGEVYNKQGNFDMALKCFENCNFIVREIYYKHPLNREFKQGLAISYQFLGNIHAILSNFSKALRFYEEMKKLFQELYIEYTNNVDFKHGLAVAHAKLGMVYLNSNIDIAITNFNSYERLSHELTKSLTEHIGFKSNYAESIAINNAMNQLISQNIDNEHLIKAKHIFNELYNQTQSPKYEQKAAIIDKMLEPDSDLKALILEMSMF